MTEATLVITRRLGAPVADVFAAWTHAEILAKWFAPEELEVADIECNAVEGGAFRVVMESADGERYAASGTYMEVIPNRRIVQTWQWLGSDAPTQLTVEFAALDGDHTELTLTHEKFRTEETRDSHHEGWTSCLRRLERLTDAAGTTVPGEPS